VGLDFFILQILQLSFLTTVMTVRRTKSSQGYLQPPKKPCPSADRFCIPGLLPAGQC
jgi:hypothetical protein